LQYINKLKEIKMKNAEAVLSVKFNSTLSPEEIDGCLSGRPGNFQKCTRPSSKILYH